jgi:asparagine synthase (glutamine-hydrolysing)
MFSEEAVRKFGIFSPEGVRGLYKKCVAKQEHAGEAGLFSNTDNMAFVGILSTQLLAQEFLFPPQASTQSVKMSVVIDRLNP